jgi:hypothetical protein
MAVLLTTVTGNLETLLGTTPSLSRVWFELNRPDWNAAGDIFAKTPVEVVADAAGAFSVPLQSTVPFLNGAVYSAVLKYRNTVTGLDEQYILASFAVPASGPVELSDLLVAGVVPPVPVDVLAFALAAQVSATASAAAALLDANRAEAAAITIPLGVATFAGLAAVTPAQLAVGAFVDVLDTQSRLLSVASGGDYAGAGGIFLDGVAVAKPGGRLNVASIGIPGDGTDATVRLQAICTRLADIGASNYLASNRVTLDFGSGQWLITGLVEFPPHVDVKGAGRALTVFNCTGTGQLRFGPDGTNAASVGIRGGRSGGFIVSGDNATNTVPIFDTGFAVERSFEDVVVKTSLVDGMHVNAAQNCNFYCLTITDCDGRGLVLDYGAGNNRFYGYEIEGNGVANVEIRQSGTSPVGAFNEPGNNQFAFGIFERRKTGGAWVASVNQLAGKFNRMVGGNIALTGQVSEQPIFRIRKAGANPSTFSIENVFCSGTISQTVLVDADDAVSVWFSGFLENHKTAFRVGDSARVFSQGVLSVGSVTNLFENQAGGTQPERNLLRMNDRTVITRMTRAVAADTVEQTFVVGESQPRAQRFANGTLNFGTGAVAVDVQIGRVSRFGIAGITATNISGGNFAFQIGDADVLVLSSAPTQASPDGSICLRTNGEIYSRIGGAWIKVQLAVSGATASRPTSGVQLGQMYFDTTLTKPIWYSGGTTVWYDATGASV